MSEVLCRIDPEDMWKNGNDTTPSALVKIEKYLTAHAVEEPPVLFAGVEEIAEWLWKYDIEGRYYNKLEDYNEDAQALLDRFGIQWDKYAVRASLYQYAKDGLSTGVTVHIKHPLPTIEEQKKALIEKINKMTPEEFKEFSHE